MVSKRLLLLLLIVFVPTGLGLFGAGAWYRRTFRSLMTPVLRQIAALAAEPESEASETAISRLTIEIASLRIKERELNDLRKLIGFEPPASSRMIAANVLGMSIDPEQRVLFLDRGTDDGIRRGAAVIAANHWVIAVVSEADARHAQARLITDAGTALSATTVHEKALPLVVRGGFGTGALLTLIPGNEPITPGMLLLTAGLEAEIPRGLMIGLVDREVPGDTPPFRSAALILSEDLRLIPRIVGVVSPTL